ncbi:MAG: DUF4115 domain-containing protein [Deltaproteobacteria bacterium]|nr:DUF4115 domain-containing protein [Deltaproteobacteria bacterium]
MDTEERHPLNLNHTDAGEDWEFPSGKELGPLLKAKRKEAGLTHAQISERLKISARFLEALENEDWDRLPSPAFIKGFIRSYARVLGLSEEGLIALYQETAPPSQPMPRPLQAMPRKKRGILYLILVFVVLAGGFVAYEWLERPGPGELTTQQEPPLPAEERSDAERIDPGGRLQLEKEEAPPDEMPGPSAPLETDTESPQEVPAPAPGPEDTRSIDHPDTLADAPQETEEPAAPSETASLPPAETPVPDTAPVPENDMPPLILKADVKERTWVRVTIDQEKPKEYILDPESNPQWRAHEGFELLIGNAGGIDLEFNGRKMENLGKQGQVIRLRLPSEDERSVSTD